MVDPPTPLDEATRRKLSHQRTRDTKPEMALRSELHRRGLRFRVDVAPLATLRRRRADIVFRPARVAVFVDGCFWHLCPEHGRIPTNNAEWWRNKLEGNAARDRETSARLREAGWLPVRVWEHEDTAIAADVVEQRVRRRRELLERGITP